MFEIPPSDEFMVENIRGILIAAFMPVDVLEKIVGADAEQFQMRAQTYVHLLNAKISSARH